MNEVDKKIELWILNNERYCTDCGEKTKETARSPFFKSSNGELQGYKIHFECSNRSLWKRIRGKNCVSTDVRELIYHIDG